MKATPATTGELAERLGCRREGDAGVLLKRVNTIEAAQFDELTFLANPKYRKYLPECRAGAVIVSENDAPDVAPGVVKLIAADAYDSFRRAIDLLYGLEEPDVPMGIDALAAVDPRAVVGEGARIAPGVVIEADAVVGRNCVIYAGAYIGSSVKLGDDCTIGANVSIRPEVIIGSRVLIGDGTVLGYDGFGYTRGPKGYTRIRPVGTVIIEDDVHLGANCCVDRATVGVTRIGRGSKLDNLIQVAHGVDIGENTVIAGQTGISGSTKIGSWVTLAGQVGLVGHIEIEDQVIIGAQAGITNSISKGQFVTGTPARPLMETRRIDVSLARLPELLKRVAALEEKVGK